MYELFKYNWQIREDWIKWCEDLSNDELIKKRTGGMGSILRNIFHVIDCEQLWINQMKGMPVIQKDISTIASLNEIKEFSTLAKTMTEHFILDYIAKNDKKILVYQKKNREELYFSYEKILHHIITHEIHHMGQLSVWAREMGKKPVPSDLMLKDLF